MKRAAPAHRPSVPETPARVDDGEIGEVRAGMIARAEAQLQAADVDLAHALQRLNEL